MCGVINMVCTYLTKVTFKRPDYGNCYKFLSKRTLLDISLGPLLTWVAWFGPVNASIDLDMYNNDTRRR